MMSPPCFRTPKTSHSRADMYADDITGIPNTNRENPDPA